MRKFFLLISLIACLALKAKATITPLNMDTPATGNLSPAGKADTFKIVTTADGQLSFTITSTNGINVTATLYDKDIATQLANTTTAGETVFNRDGLAAGTYYVRLNSYYGDQTPTYKLSWHLTEASVKNDKEPDNNKDQAIALATNATTTGHIGYYYDKQRDGEDWYKITTDGDGRLQLYLTSHNGNNVSVYLYDNDGSTQLNSTTTAGNTIVSTDGLAAGTYYIRINSYYGDQFEPYTITDSLFKPEQKNDKEPNNTKEQAITLALNSSITGHVGYYYNQQRDGADWYRVTTNSDGRLQLNLTSYNGNNVSVYLYDNDGSTQLNSTTTAGSTIVSTDGLTAGTYFIMVKSYYDNQFEPYTLTDSLFIPEQNNDSEPNDTREQALSLNLNNTVTGHIGYYYNNMRDAADWYKIVMSEDGLLQIKLTSHNGNNVSAYLYDANITQLNTGTTAGSTYFNTDGLKAGVYYVRVNSYYDNQFEPYTLTDSLFIPAQADDNEPNNTKEQALTLKINSTVTGHIGYYNNGARDAADWYKVTTNADGMLQLQLSSHNGNNVSAYLYDNDGVTQLTTITTTTTGIINTDGLGAGTYFIMVKSYYDNQFEPYTLTDSLFTYNANDSEYNNNPYQAVNIPANTLATGHVNFYYNNTRDGIDWRKISYDDSTGNLKININLLPNLSDNNPRYINFKVYKDTLGSPLYENNFVNTSNEVNITGLSKAVYYFKIATYYGDQFVAYSITPQFISETGTVKINLLKASKGTTCSSNSLLYKLSGTYPAHTIFTVTLYHNNIAYDSVSTANDTASFTALNEGKFYVTAHSFGATADEYGKSETTEFTPVSPAPVPNDIPAITKTGRLLHATAHAGNETYEWYRNNVLITGASDSTYLASKEGVYIARFANACGSGTASNSISFAADAQNQSINFTAIPDTVFKENEFIILRAKATSGLAVLYKLVSGNALLKNDTVYVLSAGSITIEASQQGNDIYFAAAPVQKSFNVTKAMQTISFTPIAAKNFGDAPFTLHAKSSSGLPVSFAIVSGAASVNDSTLTISGAGSVTVKASQQGNNNYDAAKDSLLSFCVSIKQLSDITGDSIVCPTTFKYAIQPINGAIYEWSISGGGVLTQKNDSAYIQWQTPGTYTLSVKAHSDCDNVKSVASVLTVKVTGVITPDPVTNMSPADGAANQQLPLTLSWLPGANSIFYDLYVWDADSAQSKKPYIANLVAVSYSLTNTGFKYNHAYKWRIISHNACGQVDGPIQSFSLIPLPDLIASNVQTPLSAFSGQSVAISWKVVNAGPGRTTLNQRWSDAVFLSFDSIPNFNIPPNTNPAAWNQLEFPVRPLLIGAVANPSALDSGQSYTNTLNFNIPINYNWPLYAFVVANYSPGSNAPLETTYNNDTAHALQPINVTLSPTSDLRTDSVFTPENAFSGSTINVGYKVRNYGATTPANTAWTEKIYISKEPFFDIKTALLLNLPKANGTYYYNAPEAVIGNLKQLEKDSSYSRSVAAVIPNYIHGSFYIYVVTDADNTVYEGSLENNNTNRSQIEIFITPTPLLTVSSLNLSSANVSVTQPITVNWNIKNAGYYDNIQKNKGHYLARKEHCSICYVPTCTPPAVSCDNCVFVCPPAQPGYRVVDSVGYGSSQWIDKVYLSKDSSGLDSTTAIYLGSYNHNPGTQINDDDAKATYPYGSGIPDGVDLRAYDINTSLTLNPGATFAGNLDFAIPDNLAEGSYYVYVYTNATKSVYEFPQQFQVRRSKLALKIVRPDLSVTSLSAEPSAAISGQTININYTILNSGPGSIFNHFRRDYIYMSTSPVFDANAKLIAQPSFSENVPVNASVIKQASFALPRDASGTYYFYVYTNKDSLIRENNPNNNISVASNAITITLAKTSNLSVSSVKIPNSVSSVVGFPFSYTVPNKGEGTTSGSWADSIYISCSATWNPAAAYGVAVRTHNNVVAPGDSYTDTFTLQIPYTFFINDCFGTGDASAYFYVKTNADNGLYEGTNGGSNNVFGSGLIKVTNPLVDHIVTTITASGSPSVGRPYTVNWTVKNTSANPGSKYYSSWNDAVYFSTDPVFNNKAVYAGNIYENNPLNANQTYNASLNVTVPNLPAGDYYVLVKTNFTNNIPGELNLDNNTNVLKNDFGESQSVHVTVPPLPDLVDSIITAPATVAVGQPLNITYKVANKGIGVTYPDSWSDDFWLSDDYTPGGAGDIYLGSVNHTGALNPVESYSASFTAPININATAGNYVLIARTNIGNNVFETDATNNTTFKFISVFRPAPSDLIVQNIVHADTLTLGYADSIKWNVYNNGANDATGYETDGIYLSKNSTLDSAAILLGTQLNNLNLLPVTAAATGAKPLIKNVTEGNYYMLVKTDLLNNMIETNKDNNVGVAAKHVYVKIKQLPLGVATNDNINNNDELYYKIIIPDSLDGATVLLTLKTNDSLFVTNQMYAGHEYVPTAAHFDYAYETPNAGNQQILMPDVSSGIYYITARCTSPNAPVQNVTLLARRLPFAILNVNANEGGNTGNVTIKITGSLFSAGMGATLHSAGLNKTITATAVYFINSTVVYATFNLRGASLGVYDVTLKKPDTTQTTLAKGFSIVAPNNGGLITGGGVNTGQVGEGTEPGCDPGATSGLNAQLQTQVIIPPKVFAGWPFTIQINFSNPTNVDIPAQTRIMYSLDGVPVALTKDGLGDGKTSLYIEFAEQNGLPNIIRAGGTGTITIYAKPPANYPGHKMARFELR